jgi:hypothetical protein
MVIVASIHFRAVIAVIVLVAALFAAGSVNLSGEYWFGSLSADAGMNVPWGKRGTVTVTGNNWTQVWDDNDGHHTFSSTFTTVVQSDGSVNVNFTWETIYNIAWNGNVMIHADTAPDSNGRMGIDIITRKATNIDINDVIGDHSFFGHYLSTTDRDDSAVWGNIVFDSNGTFVYTHTNNHGITESGTMDWTLDDVNAVINIPGQGGFFLGKGGIGFACQIVPAEGRDGDLGYNFITKKTDQTITPAEMAGTYQVRFLETGPGGVPYTCGRGICLIDANGMMHVDAWYSDCEHDVADGNYTIGPGNKILINAHGHISEGIISSDKGLIFAPEYDRPNPPNYYDWIGGIFMVRTIGDEPNDIADLNGDGVVDWLDLEILISHWLETTSDSNSGKDGDGITVVPYGGFITVDGNSVVVCNGVNDENAIREAYELSSPVLPTFHDYNNGNPLSLSLEDVYPCALYDSNASKYIVYAGKKWSSNPFDANWSSVVRSGFPNVSCIVPWKEGPNIWKALTRDALVNIDYYTSTDGNVWTELHNDVLSGTAGTWDYTQLDPTPPIKVAGTYYMYYNNVGRFPRSIGLATSTNLVTWTKDANNPLFTGNRFSPGVFVVDSNYYMVLCHFDATHFSKGGWHAYEEMELYRCKTPTFYPQSREFLGVIKRLPTGNGWNVCNMDASRVFTADSNRNTFPDSSKIEIIYSSFDNTATTLQMGAIYASISDINVLVRAAKAKYVTILPGRYKLRNPIISKSESLTTAYGAEFEYYDSVTDYSAAYIAGDKSIWRGGTFLDKSSDAVSYGVLFAEAGGTLEDATFYGFYRDCVVKAGYDSDVYLRKNTFGRSKGVSDWDYNVFVNTAHIFMSENNNYYGSNYVSAGLKGQGVEIGNAFPGQIGAANNCTFNRDNFFDCAITAITIFDGTNDARITNCLFDRCGRCVDMYLGDYGLIMNDLVLNGVAARTPFNIQSGSICNRVAGNTIYTLATNGIVVTSDANNTIAYNNISAAGAGVSDTSAGTTNIITGNWNGNLWPFGGYSYDTGSYDDFNDLWKFGHSNPARNLNGDGIVNFEDYAIFAEHWRAGVTP